MSKTKSSARLQRAAIKAAKACAHSAEIHARWVELFRQEYGHEDISDALVECIDYSNGNVAMITRELIHENSSAGQS